MIINILAPESDELHTILTNQRNAFLYDRRKRYGAISWN